MSPPTAATLSQPLAQAREVQGQGCFAREEKQLPKAMAFFVYAEDGHLDVHTLSCNRSWVLQSLAIQAQNGCDPTHTSGKCRRQRVSPYPWVCLNTQYPPQSAHLTLCTTVLVEWTQIFTQLRLPTASWLFVLGSLALR